MTRLSKDARRAQILAEALRVAEEIGYNKLTRDDIARGLRIPASLVCYHLGPAHAIRRAVLEEALRAGNVAVISQGLSLKDPLVSRVPAKVRAAIKIFLGL